MKFTVCFRELPTAKVGGLRVSSTRVAPTPPHVFVLRPTASHSQTRCVTRYPNSKDVGLARNYSMSAFLTASSAADSFLRALIVLLPSHHLHVPWLRHVLSMLFAPWYFLRCSLPCSIALSNIRCILSLEPGARLERAWGFPVCLQSRCRRLWASLAKLVSRAGFEPATSCSQSRRTTRLCYREVKEKHSIVKGLTLIGCGGGIRTLDQKVMSLLC